MKKATLALSIVLLFVWLTPSIAIHAEDDKVFSFELPVEGATGFAAIQMDLFDNPSSTATVVEKLAAGTAFTIKGESLDFFFVDAVTENSEFVGWVKKDITLINLPDIITSIVYYDSNSDSSLFKSSGVDLPNITGNQLYNCYVYNGRFNRKQYIMPVLYPFACKIMQAQTAALAEGNSLKIYETYRPHSVQKNVSGTLKSLMSSNSTVYSGIASWGMGWFIATSYSNHQRGRAMDVSLVKVLEMDEHPTGDCSYWEVVAYSEYDMPTEMHELSTRAVTFQYGVNAQYWKSTPLSKGMKDSEGAQLLQRYCTDAGMTPLASEWWHFDDNSCMNKCTGEFLINTCLSETP